MTTEPSGQDLGPSVKRRRPAPAEQKRCSSRGKAGAPNKHNVVKSSDALMTAVSKAREAGPVLYLKRGSGPEIL